MKVFTSIQSFDDIEQVFFKGAGLSTNTYRSYLASARQFYEFTGGLHPLQVTAADIETWFDDMIKRVDRNTAVLRIAGLKRFFVGVEKTLPESSPFRDMPKKLVKKMGKRSTKELDALEVSEVKALLAWLLETTKQDFSKDIEKLSEQFKNENDAIERIKTLQKLTALKRVIPTAWMNYATLLFLVTSGLRASEALSVTYGDIYTVDGFHYCRFIQKGGEGAKQELFPEAIDAMKTAFRAIHKRAPIETDGLFWNAYAQPLTYHSLWRRMTDLGALAAAEGVIRGDILFTPHLMRRTFATVLHGAGMSIRAVQGNTRHKNSSTLTEHYLKNKEASSPYFAKILSGE